MMRWMSNNALMSAGGQDNEHRYDPETGAAFSKMLMLDLFRELFSLARFKGETGIFESLAGHFEEKTKNFGIRALRNPTWWAAPGSDPCILRHRVRISHSNSVDPCARTYQSTLLIWTNEGKSGVFSISLENNNGTFEVSPTVGERRASFVIRVRSSKLIDFEARSTLHFTVRIQQEGRVSTIVRCDAMRCVAMSGEPIKMKQIPSQRVGVEYVAIVGISLRHLFLPLLRGCAKYKTRSGNVISTLKLDSSTISDGVCHGQISKYSSSQPNASQRIATHRIALLWNQLYGYRLTEVMDIAKGLTPHCPQKVRWLYECVTDWSFAGRKKKVFTQRVYTATNYRVAQDVSGSGKRATTICLYKVVPCEFMLGIVSNRDMVFCAKVFMATLDFNILRSNYNFLWLLAACLREKTCSYLSGPIVIKYSDTDRPHFADRHLRHLKSSNHERAYEQKCFRVQLDLKFLREKHLVIEVSMELRRNEGAGKREISEKTRRPNASSGTIPIFENPVTRPGIEPGSPWWENSTDKEGAGDLRVRGRGHSTVGCYGGQAERLVSCVRARRRLVARTDSWESQSLACSGGGGRKDTRRGAVSVGVVARELGPGGSLSSMARVTVYIDDVNDNAPVFEKDSYEITLPENMTAGTTVTQVLLPHHPLPPKTSKAESKYGLRRLDGFWSETSNYVDNMAVPGRRPTWPPAAPTKMADGSGSNMPDVCAKVRAEDADTGLFGEVQYTQILGHLNTSLTLDSITGLVTVSRNNHRFDRETAPGSAPISFMLVVRPCGNTSNYCKTRFPPRLLSSEIAVMKSTCMHVVYSSALWKMNIAMGLITLFMHRQLLQRKHVTVVCVCVRAEFPFHVEARDTEGTGNRELVPLVIKLLDVNDETPRFEKDLYEFFLTPNQRNFTAPAFVAWSEVISLPSQEARTVAGVLIEHVFSRFRVTLELHSDQGRNFEAAVFQEVTKILRMKLTRTTALHPQSDGMVERLNRTLEQYLSIFVTDNQKDWYLKMLFGRQLRLPSDLLFGRPTEEESAAPDYASELRSRLVGIHDFARQHLIINSDGMKTFYDKNVGRGSRAKPKVVRIDRLALYDTAEFRAIEDEQRETETSGLEVTDLGALPVSGHFSPGKVSIDRHSGTAGRRECLQIRLPACSLRVVGALQCQILKARFGQRMCRTYSDCVNVTSLEAEFQTRPHPQERQNAIDMDAEPPNNVVRYEIISGNYANKFTLDEVTGD
ncbi:hypothetical protein PR048_030462 [Dryococelus australis]|uniref:Cadherin domain-containing protein n=1 Tax=Dryococelus australis TaxID=614101 RepID=A0ABQ9GCX2_9NEOP|nr:hypothetical protein PR048_030462 [Dryococelus australis]